MLFVGVTALGAARFFTRQQGALAAAGRGRRRHHPAPPAPGRAAVRGAGRGAAVPADGQAVDRCAQQAGRVGRPGDRRGHPHVAVRELPRHRRLLLAGRVRLGRQGVRPGERGRVRLRAQSRSSRPLDVPAAVGDRALPPLPLGGPQRADAHAEPRRTAAHRAAREGVAALAPSAHHHASAAPMSRSPWSTSPASSGRSPASATSASSRASGCSCCPSSSSSWRCRPSSSGENALVATGCCTMLGADEPEPAPDARRLTGRTSGAGGSSRRWPAPSETARPVAPPCSSTTGSAAAPPTSSTCRRRTSRGSSTLLDAHDVVSLDAALDRLDAGDARPSVVLTFDDGFDDVHANAWPLLKERGLPFTVYLASGLRGPHRWSGRARRPGAPPGGG